MFAPNSRYYQLATYIVTLPNGRTVSVVRCAVRGSQPLAGYHRRVAGDRLDLLAARYLSDPTTFWKLCDANNAPAPDALAAADLDRHPTERPIDMSTYFDIIVGGASAPDFDADVIELEVEENADLPGAISLTLPVSLNEGGDYDTVSDPRLAPLANIAVVATAADNQQHCLFDGFILAQQVHLDTGTAASTMKVWGQDASWLMNVRELAKEWVNVTDGAVANTIFGNYGKNNFTPHRDNLADDGPIHAEDGATLMQRASDAQFLRALARRNGKLFRVYLHGYARRTHRLFRRTESQCRARGPALSQRQHAVERRHARLFLRHHATEHGQRLSGAVHRPVGRRQRRRRRHDRRRPAGHGPARSC